MIIGSKLIEFTKIHVYLAICLDFSDNALSISEKNKVDADNYHYFSYDNKYGTAGVAATMRLFANSDALGSVCWRNQRERTAISEWLNDEATTALVIYLKID